MIRLLFRKQNYLLFLAAGINLSLVFAPLGYAANYSQNIYAWLHGSWITIQRADPAGGADNYTSVSFAGDWMLFCFATLTTILGIALFLLIFVNRKPAFKIRWLVIIFFALIVQALLGWALENHLVSYLGNAAPGDLDTRLQAQYWLHIFPPLFTYWAWHSVRKGLPKAKKSGQSGKVETVVGID